MVDSVQHVAISECLLDAGLVPFLVGFGATVGQIILMREVVVLFGGNELALGIVLAFWLAWTAAGSYIAGHLTRASTNVRTALAIVECLCGLSLPLTICTLRVIRAHWQTVPGELFGPMRIALICLACLSAFCALSGAAFAISSQMLRQRRTLPPHLASSSAYLLETAGAALGGIVTSILLLRFFGCVQISAIIALLCLWIGGALLFRTKRAARVATTVALAALGAPLLMVVAPRVETWTQQLLWPGFTLVDSRESMYGRISVIDSGGLKSLYDNGSILANVPDPAAAEESVHYALLEHPAPRRVLLIGGGVNGSVAQALKHPTIQQLDFVEIDPALIAVYRKLFPHESAVLSDPRMRLHQTDGRLYLRTSTDRFDVVIVNLPDPESAQLNRFYTVEFFRSVREHLASGGLLALQLRASENTVRPELAAYLRCIHRTLRQVFPHVVAIPGESFHLFAAADPAALTDDPRELISRLKSRRLQTQYVREYFVPFRMMPDRMAEAAELLQSRPDTPVNRDFLPAAYSFSNLIWSGQVDLGSALLLERMERIRFSAVIAAVIIPSLVLLAGCMFLAGSQRRAGTAAIWCVGAAGCNLMALQILLLLAFQAIFGTVYHELALLIGMFMCGIAFGNWLGIRRTRNTQPSRLLQLAALNQLMLAAAAPLLLLVVSALAQGARAGMALTASHAAFLILSLLCAIPGGYQFPVASALYLGERSQGTSLATLYALDLLGGCVGALALAGFLVPVFGFWKVAWLSATISIAPALLAALPRSRAAVS